MFGLLNNIGGWRPSFSPSSGIMRFRRPIEDTDSYIEYSIKIDLDKENAQTLDGTEIGEATKRACGISSERDKSNVCVTPMIVNRSIGPGFSIAQKRKIAANFLPNKNRLVASYNNKVYCSLFSQDGKFLLTACQDKFLRLYQRHNDRFVEHKVIPGKDVGWSIVDAAFSPDGKYVVYSTWSECLYVCPVYGSSVLLEPISLNPYHRRFCTFSVIFSHDGREILGGANDCHLYIYDREYHRRTARLELHGRDLNAIAFADNTSQILYTGGDDGLCKVWDKRMLNESSLRPVGTFAGHRGGITYIDSRGDSRYLITNSKDQTIKLWDVRAFSPHYAEDATLMAVLNDAWDYRWQRAPMELTKPGMPNIFGDSSIMTYRGHSVLQTLIRCHFSPVATTGQKYIYTGCNSGGVIIYDVLTGKKVKTLRRHITCVRDVSWHPTHQEIISSAWDGEVRSWQYSGDVSLDNWPSKNERKTDSSDSEDGTDRHSSEPIDQYLLLLTERIAAEEAQRNRLESLHRSFLEE